MAKLNKVCIVCHKKYEYCPSCSGDANKPSWMAVFCCDNCRILYNTINDYRHKLLSKEKAFEILNKLDLSYVNELPKNFKESFDEIMKAEKIETVLESVVMAEPSMEEFVINSVIEETAIENTEKPVKYKKRKKINVMENIEE